MKIPEKGALKNQRVAPTIGRSRRGNAGARAFLSASSGDFPIARVVARHVGFRNTGREFPVNSLTRMSALLHGVTERRVVPENAYAKTPLTTFPCTSVRRK